MALLHWDRYFLFRLKYPSSHGDQIHLLPDLFTGGNSWWESAMIGASDQLVHGCLNLKTHGNIKRFSPILVRFSPPSGDCPLMSSPSEKSL